MCRVRIDGQGSLGHGMLLEKDFKKGLKFVKKKRKLISDFDAFERK